MNTSQHNFSKTVEWVKSVFPDWSLEAQPGLDSLQIPKVKTPIVLNILIFFASFFAVGTLSAFLGILGLYDNEFALIFFGILFLGGTVYLSHVQPVPMFHGAYLAFFMTGKSVLAIGIYLLFENVEAVSLLLMLISFGLLFILRNYVMLIVSMIIIHYCVLFFLFTLGVSSHFLYVYLPILLGLLVYVFAYEIEFKAKNKHLETIYYPLRDALSLIWIQMMLFSSQLHYFSEFNLDEWVFWIFHIIALIFILRHMLLVLDLYNETRYYALGMLLTLLFLPTVFTPAITGTMVLLLLSFHQRYLLGMIMSIVGFVWFISKFYYDLSMSLFEKSLILIGVGIIFIGLYFWVQRKFKTYV